MKSTTLYTCGACAYQSPKWLGRCPQCEGWNSFSEERIEKSPPLKRGGKISSHAREPKTFDEVIQKVGSDIRSATGMFELDRVLGGGFVPGSLTLFTGEPGIGKSTLTLQIAAALGREKFRVLYVSGEESETQISLRGKRLGLTLPNLQLLTETSMEIILATASKEKTDFLIIDSIQVMHSEQIAGSAGSVSQVRFCTEMIMEMAKSKGLSVLLVGHVTKDGTLAGPRVLEHLVDTVLYLEGSRSHEMRILRGVKNRFGDATEVGIFEMSERGLVEVKNPTLHFVENRAHHGPGSALVMTIEGARPLLLEVQALTSPTAFGYPRRTASGFDLNRLNLLIAVLQKYVGINLSNQDVYVNVVSGYRLHDPACDLGVCLALLSSFKKSPVRENLVAIGEVGLSGEVRTPKDIAKRRKEVERLGFSVCGTFKTVSEIENAFFHKGH